MEDIARLIEHAFPLKQASLASVHEKNVRHGHLSTLHIWPARRPLAASRAALIATLLGNPSTAQERIELCERIGGKLVKTTEKKKMPNGKVVERVKEEVEGGVLTWIGTEPKSGGKKKKDEYHAIVDHREDELRWFRQKIRDAYGGRAPRVMDPFAGGGAIPLEAMRLGCEATALDLNPVAWFVLKCTLEYPQQMEGKRHPLPEFALSNEEFMADFYKSHPHLVGRTKKTKRQIENERLRPGLFDKEDSGRVPKADLAWQLRAWGTWVLGEARKRLAEYYPTYADFEPLSSTSKPFERQHMRLVPLSKDGGSNLEELNSEFSPEYLGDKTNPRWVPKATVAYLWARTIACKNCRVVVPMLKTRWVCKKDKKRVLLTLDVDTASKSVCIGLDTSPPIHGGNAAQKREHDKKLGQGTMSRSGVQCPCCNTITQSEDIRMEGRAGRIGDLLLAVVIDTPNGKGYRLPTDHEVEVVKKNRETFLDLASRQPLGQMEEPVPRGGSRKGGGSPFTIWLYGIQSWQELFTPRQSAAIAAFVCATREAHTAMLNQGYPRPMADALLLFLTCVFDRFHGYSSSLCRWINNLEAVAPTFARFALPMLWDYCETAPLSKQTGGYSGAISWVAKVVEHLTSIKSAEHPRVICGSATSFDVGEVDVIVTDPPYYDAIPYSDLMDYFYVVLRRILADKIDGFDKVFKEPLAPKWDHEKNDGELIDDASRFDGDMDASKGNYEDGMARAFVACHRALSANGRLVIVFAHKQPDAWETLASAIIRSGFVVDASWPIMTERAARARAHGSAALASSVWLVCKKRSELAKPGWDNRILDEMRRNVQLRLREYWDAGIRGPDFVWAATGPALEAYSQHPLVKMANEPGAVLTVGEFLGHARRIVVDFVVGQVLTGNDGENDPAAADRMDSITAYYLLHRHDFMLDEAPAGACILYATACGLTDRELESSWNVIASKGAATPSEDDEQDEDGESKEGSGGTLRLKTWKQRNHRSMGFEAPTGQEIPLIDRVHRLMHLWKDGDVHKVDGYLDDNGLRRHELFKRLIQSLIELALPGDEERTLLESLSNHVEAKGAKPVTSALPFSEEDE